MAFRAAWQAWECLSCLLGRAHLLAIGSTGVNSRPCTEWLKVVQSAADGQQGSEDGTAARTARGSCGPESQTTEEDTSRRGVAKLLPKDVPQAVKPTLWCCGLLSMPRVSSSPAVQRAS